MSDLVGNPEDRFSRVAAHLTLAVESDVKHKTNQVTHPYFKKWETRSNISELFHLSVHYFRGDNPG